jgi:uncharacterized protein YlxW (UPF0749 family)
MPERFESSAEEPTVRLGPSGAMGSDGSPGAGGGVSDGAVGASSAREDASVPAVAGDGGVVPDPDVVAVPDVPVGADTGGVLGSVRARFSAAGVMIAVLLALLGFTLVVQVKTTSTDAALSSMRQEDLVRILSDLEAQEERLQQDIAGLEESQRQLRSGAEGQRAALEEAARQADELGILAGRLPARGPGMLVQFSGVSKPLRASALLDAVQELRGAGAEAMQISGGNDAAVRIVAGTYFLDAEGGVVVGGRRLTGPYTITVIGDPKTMRTALNIPGGVVASVSGDGGTVIVQERETVDVTALSAPTELQYARPVS